MEHKDKIQVIIASNQFIQRLGLKAIVSTIGLKHDLYEVCSINELIDCLKEENNLNRYVIIAENIISNTKTKIDTFIEEYVDCKFLYVSSQIPEQSAINYFVLNSWNAQDTIEKFNLFFFSEKEETNLTIEKSLLSGREIDVIREVALGLSNKEIAEKLFISINTVISHRKNITDKLDIKSIAGLTVYAMMNNLINPDDIT